MRFFAHGPVSPRAVKVPASGGEESRERAQREEFSGRLPPRISTRSNRCSARCCSPRPRSPRRRRCSRPTTSTAAGTVRSSPGDGRPVPEVGARRPGFRVRSARPARIARRRSAVGPPCSPWRRPFPSSRMRGAMPRSCRRDVDVRGLVRVGHRGRAVGLRPPGRHARVDRVWPSRRSSRSRGTARARTARSSSSRSTRPSTDSPSCSSTCDGGGVTGLPTGFGELDRQTSGLQKSNLVILAARPSMGKTSLALNIAEHVCGDAAEAGRAVLARDVEGRDRAAAAVLGRQGRPEPAEAGPARGRRLDAGHRGDGDARAALRSTSTTRVP